MAVKELVQRVFNRKKRQYDLEDYIRHQKERGFVGAAQVVDGTPMAPPIGYKKAPSMVEIVREAVRSEHLRQAAIAAGHETFEESEDFDIADDPVQMSSPYENEFDPPLEVLLEAGRKSLAEKEAQNKASGAAPAPKPGPATEAVKASGERSATLPPDLPENG